MSADLPGYPGRRRNAVLAPGGPGPRLGPAAAAATRPMVSPRTRIQGPRDVVVRCHQFASKNSPARHWHGASARPLAFGVRPGRSAVGTPGTKKLKGLNRYALRLGCREVGVLRKNTSAGSFSKNEYQFINFRVLICFYRCHAERMTMAQSNFFTALRDGEMKLMHHNTLKP